MKKLLLGALALTLVVSACKKKDDNGIPSNTISINGTNYSVIPSSGIIVSGGGVQAVGLNGTNGGSIFFDFGVSTLTSGTYTVVADSTTPTATQVSFAASSISGASSTTYLSTGAGSVKATVTVSGGKVSISMPDAPAKSGTSTVNVHANVSQ